MYTQSQRRTLVICAEDTPAAAHACEWVVQDVYREGDKLHLIYVVTALKPPLEILHTVPGTSYQFSQPGKHREAERILHAEAAINARYLPILKKKMVPYELHLYADREDCSSKTVGADILHAIDKIHAECEGGVALVVLAAHNRKKKDMDRWEGEVGGVAEYVMTHCKQTLAIIHPYETSTT